MLIYDFIICSVEADLVPFLSLQLIIFLQTPLQTPMPTPLPGTAQTPLPGTAQTPLPGTVQTPLPGTADSSMYNIPTGGTPITPNDYPAVNDQGGVTEMKPGRPNPYMVDAIIYIYI